MRTRRVVPALAALATLVGVLFVGAPPAGAATVPAPITTFADPGATI